MRRLLPLLFGAAALLVAMFAHSTTAQAATSTLVAQLSHANEVPPTATTTTGTAHVTVDNVANKVCVTLELQNQTIGNVTAMHIHTGAAGVNGAVVIPFTPGESACANPTAQQVSDLLANPAGFYFNIHTAANAGGEARGQLAAVAPSPTPKTLKANLSNLNEVPPNNSGTTGTATVTVDSATNQVCVMLTLQGQTIDKVVAMHIHPGAAGVNGPVVIPFTPGANSCANPSPSAKQVADLLANPAGFYFNIHTAANPNGEARGQLDGSPAPTPSMMTTTTTSKPMNPPAVPAQPSFTG